MPEVTQPLTTYSINHEATIDLDSTNAFEGMFASGGPWSSVAAAIACRLCVLTVSPRTREAA